MKQEHSNRNRKESMLLIYGRGQRGAYLLARKEMIYLRHQKLNSMMNLCHNLICSIRIFTTGFLIFVLFFVFKFICVCMPVCMCIMCIVPEEGRKSHWIPWNWRVTESCEPPCGCQNLNQIQGKSRQCSSPKPAFQCLAFKEGLFLLTVCLDCSTKRPWTYYSSFITVSFLSLEKEVHTYLAITSTQVKCVYKIFRRKINILAF